VGFEGKPEFQIFFCPEERTPWVRGNSEEECLYNLEESTPIWGKE